jgi:hypothetical protein
MRHRASALGFTADLERGLATAGRVRAGTFGVNQGYIMDPRGALRRREEQRLRSRARPRKLPRHEIHLVLGGAGCLIGEVIKARQTLPREFVRRS